MRRWISIGGWPAPSLLLTELGLQSNSEALPFDGISCTFDAVTHMTRTGSWEGFLPATPCPPATAFALPDEMDRHHLTFRGWHTSLGHVNLNSDAVRSELQRRWTAWDSVLSPTAGLTRTRPVTFLRAVVSANAMDELHHVFAFHDAVRQRSQGRLPFRTVVVVCPRPETPEAGAAAVTSRQQPGETRPLCALASAENPCMVWQAAPRIPSTSPPTAADVVASSSTPKETSSMLYDMYRDGLQQVVTTMSKEMKWRPTELSALPSLEAFTASHRTLLSHQNLYSWKGISLFRGTSTGFGSVRGAEEITSDTSSSPEAASVWTEGEADQLLMAYGMADGDELVAAEESSRECPAHGARESYVKLLELVYPDVGGAESGTPSIPQSSNSEPALHDGESKEAA